MTVEKMNIKLRQLTKLHKEGLISAKLIDRMITEAKKRFPDMPVEDILNVCDSFVVEVVIFIRTFPWNLSFNQLFNRVQLLQVLCLLSPVMQICVDLHILVYPKVLIFCVISNSMLVSYISPHHRTAGMEYRPPLYSGNIKPITPTEELESTLQTIVSVQQRRLSRDTPTVTSHASAAANNTTNEMSSPAILDSKPSLTVSSSPALLKNPSSPLSAEVKPTSPHRLVLPPISKPTSRDTISSLAIKVVDDIISVALSKASLALIVLRKNVFNTPS